MSKPSPVPADEDRSAASARCSPAALEGLVPLEPRLLLSASAEPAASAAHIAAERRSTRLELHHAKAAHPSRSASRPPRKSTPSTPLSRSAFTNVLNDYVNRSTSNPPTHVTVSATVTAAYTPPSAVIQVDDASVFGPEGTFTPPIVANAIIGTVSFGSVTLTGSSGNLLIVSIRAAADGFIARRHRSDSQRPHLGAKQRRIDLPDVHHRQHDPDGHQSGEVLQQASDQAARRRTRRRTRPFSAVRSRRSSIEVSPALRRRASISIRTAASPPSLQQLLLAIPLPTTAGSDLQIYKAAVTSAIAESHQQLRRRHHADLQSHLAGERAAASKPTRRKLQFQQRIDPRAARQAPPSGSSSSTSGVDLRSAPDRACVDSQPHRAPSRSSPRRLPSLPKRYRTNNP